MLSRSDAREMLRSIGTDSSMNFHSLPSATVERIIEAADAMKYRAPKNANGSRARYFHAYLVRRACSEQSR